MAQLEVYYTSQKGGIQIFYCVLEFSQQGVFLKKIFSIQRHSLFSLRSLLSANVFTFRHSGHSLVHLSIIGILMFDPQGLAGVSVVQQCYFKILLPHPKCVFTCGALWSVTSLCVVPLLAHQAKAKLTQLLVIKAETV